MSAVPIAIGVGIYKAYLGDVQECIILVAEFAFTVSSYKFCIH